MISFRDITGEDLEYLETMFKEDGKTTLTGDQVVDILNLLYAGSGSPSFSSLTPWTIRFLYREVSEHILSSYIPKQSWLKQCYSIQNGSFQNVLDMEKVPMSKFVAMCVIHKEAMDTMNPTPDGNNPV